MRRVFVAGDSEKDARPVDAGQDGVSDDDELSVLLIDLYLKFKLRYYQKVLKQFQNRKASLSADEGYSAEAIYALGSPTVSEFANFMQISPQSAAYKVGNLVKKGYVTKSRSEEDKREFRLSVTDRFMKYYVLGNRYVFDVSGRIRANFSKDELEKFTNMLRRIVDELTDEISNPLPDVNVVKEMTGDSDVYPGEPGTDAEG
jgi:DNA-binding MarR family transcriptional regulator